MSDANSLERIRFVATRDVISMNYLGLHTVVNASLHDECWMDAGRLTYIAVLLRVSALPDAVCEGLYSAVGIADPDSPAELQ